MSKELDDLNIYVQKTVKKSLTLSQCERVGWALIFTEEALIECGVPYDKREKELAAVAKELVEEFDNGEHTYPNAPTEMVWTKRASVGWQYCSTAGAAGSRHLTLIGAAQDSGEGEGLGKGNGSEVAE